MEIERISSEQSLWICGIVGLILYLLYRYLCLWRRSRFLAKQLQVQHQLTEQAFAEIHNGPLQLLAFLIREIQLRDVSQQELLQHLREVYQDVASDLQNLQNEP